MGFQKFINSKKIFSLLAVLLLSGTSLLMAQDVGAATTNNEHTPPDWGSVFYYVLLFLVLCFAIAIVGKVLKVYDVTKQMQGKKPMNWNNIMGVFCIVFLVVGLCGAIWSLSEQGSMSLPESASEHGKTIDTMFSVTSFITLIVFFATQIMLFSFLFLYRASTKRKAFYLPHNNTIEKIWTIAPAIVLTILVVFGFFTWQKIQNSGEQKGDINIDVTGHQFAWELRYPGADGKLGDLDYKLTTPDNILGIDFKDRRSLDDQRADTLVLPVDTYVRLNIHAQDVIHSVYMPHFRLQQNAVPGLPTFFRFKPTITTAAMRIKTDNPKFDYLLYCNKICGTAHYNMQKVVRVVSQAEYQEWVARQKPYLTDKVRQEFKVAAQIPAAGEKKSLSRLALNN